MSAGGGSRAREEAEAWMALEKDCPAPFTTDEQPQVDAFAEGYTRAIAVICDYLQYRCEHATGNVREYGDDCVHHFIEAIKKELS